jgi:hypothetical protein
MRVGSKYSFNVRLQEKPYIALLTVLGKPGVPVVQLGTRVQKLDGTP